jgi:signal transduction histidine kinase
MEDGRTVPTSDGPTADGLRVPARIDRLSFSFSAFFLRAQDGLRFRYKLENFDKAWNVATSNRIATYTNLPAGHYRFRVVAYDTSNPQQESEVDLAFSKAPFFYQTAWFYTLCGLALAAIAWSIYRLRLRQMRTRFAAVLEERSRLAREMHDTVIQGCTGISALLEAVASTGEENSDARGELLEYARQQARSTINEARQVVWNMRHEHESDVDLIDALRGVANQTMREFGDTVTLTHDVDHIPLQASAAHEILMTVREAVNNSVQHSGAKQVMLDVHADEGDLTISIADRGRGFPADASDPSREGHYGILGMRERMQRVGGRLELASTEGEGTRVTLLLRPTGRRKSVVRS